LFTDKDWRTFQGLPERLTIYRGAKTWNLSGMSWTLDVDRAIYFATHHHHDGFPARLDDPGHVYEQTVEKDAVLFYTDERKEKEIILRQFSMGRMSAAGEIELAAVRGPEHALAEFDRQKARLSRAEIAEFSKYVPSWTAFAKSRAKRKAGS
jgi:hypothetical protein